METREGTLTADSTEGEVAYRILTRQYTLLVCGDIVYREKVTPQKLQETKLFNIALPFKKHPMFLRGVSPSVIDLEGNWEFRLSEEYGRRVRESAKSEENVLWRRTGLI
mgnify:CR=1 FL=1